MLLLLPIRGRVKSTNLNNYKREKGFTPEKQKLLSHNREKEAKEKAKNTALGQLLGSAPILPTQPRIVDNYFFCMDVFSMSV